MKVTLLSDEHANPNLREVVVWNQFMTKEGA